MDQLTPDAYIDDLVGAAERHAEQQMPGKRTAKLKHQLTESATVAGKKRAAVAVIHEAHGAAEVRHESERNQQRGILYFAAGFFAAAVVMIVVQAIMPASDRIIPLPSNGVTMAGGALPALVMVFGMLGGGAQRAGFALHDRKEADQHAVV